jgi:DNA (cytosine-5)-methyltransferase 1
MNEVSRGLAALPAACSWSRSPTSAARRWAKRAKSSSDAARNRAGEGDPGRNCDGGVLGSQDRERVPSPLMAGTVPSPDAGLRVGALFAGIGGIELGLRQAGHHAVFFCENDPAASAVLAARFEGVPVHGDVRQLVRHVDELPQVDVLTGGFPCQDLSQAGRVAGIGGEKSGLVTYMFELLDELDRRVDPPTWLVIENVTNMLCLDGGRAMRFLTESLERRGYGWAYRVVDTLGFGLPQRRKRVIMLASKRMPMAPARVLFADEAGEPATPEDPSSVGFYWTEGLRGIGWAPNAVPTLKGGSGLGIPSPPAIWLRHCDDETRAFRLLSLDQAELLQGFEAGWTDVDLPGEERRTSIGERWKMIGNAVSVPVSRWLGERLRRFGDRDELTGAVSSMDHPTRWPDAASGFAGKMFVWSRSNFPLTGTPPSLLEFVGEPTQGLSAKAALGFRERTLRGNLRIGASFGAALDAYLAAHDVSKTRVRKLSRERAEAAEQRQRERREQDYESQLRLPLQLPVSTP